VVIVIPKNSTPVWGAFSSVVKSGEAEAFRKAQAKKAELEKFVQASPPEDPISADYF